MSRELIKGIGIDILEVERIKLAIIRHPNFICRNFSEQEMKYFSERNDSAESIAGNFSAKEAYVKAEGKGFREHKLKEIEVLRNELGAPFLLVKNILIESLISISHTSKTVVAVVVVF